MFVLFTHSAINARIGALFESLRLILGGILCQNQKIMKKAILLCTMLAGLVANAQVPGTLDSSFGNNGVMRWTSTTAVSHSPKDMRLLPDGKFMMAGEVSGSNQDLLLAKFKANGMPDSSLQGASYGMYDPLLGADDNMYCMEVLPDGKVLLGGSAQGANDIDVVIYKINTDGSVDNTWGNNGKVVIDAGDNETAMKIKVMPDGKILIGCTNYGNNTSNMVMVRLMADGTPDNTFSGDGISSIVFVGQTQGNLVDMEVLPGGNIIVLGTISDGVLAQIGMAKLNNAGQGMPVFGVASKFKFSLDGKSTQATNMIRTSKNKLLITGVQKKANNDDAGVLLMVDTAGIMDNVFASGKGVIAYDKTNLAEDDRFADVMEMKNGYFFVMSNYIDIDNKRHLQCIVFDESGNMRLDYGNSGIILHSPDVSLFTIGSLAIMIPQPDGKVLIAGGAKNTATNKNEFLVYRLNLENKAASTVVSATVAPQVKIYPNPASGYFSISTSTKVDEVWMVDASGRVAAQWAGTNNTYAIPQTVANGLYYIKVKSADGQSVSPININR
ncbi:hypothetical protein CAP35_11295 [Chitinophagaceae bacterium IBVUCB1]|nr:hypothetical protein CAP35_11295 [Chitinophagaceae bacterium IBVUCB1]